MISWFTDKVDDLLDFVFKFFAFLLKPYYEKEHFKEKRSISDYVRHMVNYYGIWIIIAIIYCVLFYVFIIDEGTRTIPEKLQDFGTKPPLEVIQLIYKKLLESIWANSFFIYVFYKAVTSYSEKEFLKDHFVYHKYSGLIKVIRIGHFNSQSLYTEQELDKVEVGRKHFYKLVADEKHENITLLCASGWDFFGVPNKQDTPVLDKQAKPLGKFKKFCLTIFKFVEVPNLENGYLLKFLGMRNKHFNILLIDPDSSSCDERAASYLDDGAHHVIDEQRNYSENIKTVIKNIAKSSKLNSHVRVRLIKAIPPWKILKVDKEIWVQPVIRGARSDHTMLYGYKNSPHSVYHIYFNKIEDLWNSAGQDIDLNSYR